MSDPLLFVPHMPDRHPPAPTPTASALVGAARRLLFLIAACILLNAPARADLEDQTRQIIANAGLRNTTVSVLLYDLGHDAPVLDLEPDRAMIPASNLKLITTAAALDALGPDFKFTTDLDLLEPATPDAPPDLILRGKGDPALGDDVLLKQLELEPDDVVQRWVDAVEQAGHTHIGTLIVDDTIFDQQFTHPDWPQDQLHKHYAAQVGGLNFHGNALDILYLPSQPGEAPIVKVYPLFPQLATVNRAVTGSQDAFWIQRDATANRFTFGGQVRNARSEPLRTTIHDPAIFTGQYLRHRLAERGITVDRVARPRPQDRRRTGTTLYRVESTLAGILDRTNQDSVNLFAECLFKRLGFELTGQPGGFDNGAAAVRMYLHRNLGQRFQAAIVKPVDGSGLARSNRVTARALVEVLRDMHRRDDLRDLYRDSLSTAGQNGTLRRRGRQLTAATVHGKSGYINGVSCLSGYMVFPDPTAPTGERTYAFSMLFNGFAPPVTNASVKTVQDQILSAFEEALAPQVFAAD